jgi:uncharacterized protein YjdB
MSITVSPTSASIAPGSTLQLTSSAPAKWESACPDIATVSQSGLVTATAGTYRPDYYVTGGQVQILATKLRGDGSPGGPVATCLVTVLGTGTRPFLTANHESAIWQNSL